MKQKLAIHPAVSAILIVAALVAAGGGIGIKLAFNLAEEKIEQSHLAESNRIAEQRKKVSGAQTEQKHAEKPELPPEEAIEQKVWWNKDSASVGNTIWTNAFPNDFIITACAIDEYFCMDLEVIGKVDNDLEASVPKHIFDQFPHEPAGSMQLLIKCNDDECL